MTKVVFSAWVAAGALATGVLWARQARYIWNTTASVPRGLWRLREGQLARGDVVALCPPNTAKFRDARSAGIVPLGDCPGGFVPLLKPVAALPGDQVKVNAQGLWINGLHLPKSELPASASASKATTPYTPGLYTVEPGQIWLASSSNPRSWDSRYFGPIPAHIVRGIAVPVWLP